MLIHSVVYHHNDYDTCTREFLCDVFLLFQSPYAQLLAATTLTKVISRSGTMIPIQDRVEIRNYILNYFATRPKLEPYVQQALMLVSFLTSYTGEKLNVIQN